MNGTAAKKPAAATDDPATAPSADGWSNIQQKQMEDGMKKYPGSLPTKERWLKISEEVEGKSAKECFERFKFIVAKMKAAQGAKWTLSELIQPLKLTHSLFPKKHTNTN